MIFSNAKSVAGQQINNAVWRAALKDDGKTNQIHVEGQLMISENTKLIKQPCHSKKKVIYFQQQLHAPQDGPSQEANRCHKT